MGCQKVLFLRGKVKKSSFLRLLFRVGLFCQLSCVQLLVLQRNQNFWTVSSMKAEAAAMQSRAHFRKDRI